MVKQNVSTVAERALSEEEKLMLGRLKTEVFSQLTVHNWEHKEVERYQADPEKFVRFSRSGNVVDSDKQLNNNKQ